MLKESYVCEEVVYVTGIDLEDAKDRRKYNSHPTPRKAYDDLGYFDREDDDYDVYEFVVTTSVTKVEPPYSK